MAEIMRIDFETGDLSQFDRVVNIYGNIIEVVNNPVSDGNYAMHIGLPYGQGGVYGLRNFVSKTSFHFIYKFLIPDTFGTEVWARPLEIRGENLKKIYLDVYSNDRIGISTPAGAYFAGPLTRGTYHTIEVFIDIATNGSLVVILDGITLFEQYGGVEMSGYCDVFSTGMISAGGGIVSGDIYMDSILLEDWAPPTAPPQPPIADFVFYPTTPEPGEAVTFSAYLSYDLDDQIASYEWNIGGLILTGMDAVIILDATGVYQATLTVTDTMGLSSSKTLELTVETRPPISPVKWALPFRVVGNLILDANDIDVTKLLTGVGKMGFEYCDPSESGIRECNPAYFDHDLDLMASWGVNLIRMTLNINYYMTYPEYRETIREFVDKATQRGMLLILCSMRISRWGWEWYPIGHTITREEGWAIMNYTIWGLKNLVHDFKYNPHVIGIEINEFRPYFIDDIEDYCFTFRAERTKALADAVYPINPDILIGEEFMLFKELKYHTKSEMVSIMKAYLDYVPTLVYMPHTYFASHYGWSMIWDQYATDPEGGKIAMYNILESQFLDVREAFNLPAVVTEWGSDYEQGPQIIKDQFDWFMAHNWGSAYWAWFRAGPVGAAYYMGLLCDDWETPSFAGGALLEKMVEYGFTEEAPPTPKPRLNLRHLLLAQFAGGVGLVYIGIKSRK